MSFRMNTKMRLAGCALVLVSLAACAPEVPESDGFDSYNSYAADREAQLRGLPIPSQQVPQQGFDPARASAAIDAAEGGVTPPLNATNLSAPPPATGVVQPYSAPVPQGSPYGAVIGGGETLQADRPRGDAPANIQVQTGELVHMNGGNSGGISDEQDFNAVSSRETIESDAQRIARNKAQYTVIEPTAVPERPGDTGPNIAQYAINTRNAVGERIYSRSSIRLNSPEAACKRYRSPDLAQEAFLNSGGPDRDPKGLDPDGDGFACAWDPAPFRSALQ